MIVEVIVAPDSRRFAIGPVSKDGRVKISLRSPPENNRANVELVSELSKLTGRQVRLISGHTSKRKKLSIGMSEGEWKAFRESLPSR